jgi:hypothetical protein
LPDRRIRYSYAPRVADDCGMCRHTFCILGLLVGSGLAQAQATVYPFTLAQGQVPAAPQPYAPVPQAQPMPAPLPALAPLPPAMRAPMPAGAPEIQRVSAPAVDTVPDTATSDKLTRFDVSKVMVQRNNQHWVVAAGDVVVKDFGTDMQTAHEAARLIKGLKVDQLGKIGDPAPVMEYWLIDGQAPPMPVGNQHAIELEPAKLHVEMDPTLGRWCVKNSTRTLFSSFTREEDARQAIQVIRDHGFTHVMTLGQGKPVMQLFVNGTGNAIFPRTPLNAPENTIHAAKPNPDGRMEMPAGPVAQGSATDPMVHPIMHNQRMGSEDMTRPSMPAQESTLHDSPAPGKLSTAMGAQATEMPHQSARPSEKISFDFRHAMMRKDNNNCTLSCGSQVLASFGTDEPDAKKALFEMGHYQLTEMHRVGGAQSQFSYFLSHGKAPLVTDLTGVRYYSLDLPTLQVRRDNDGYVLANQQLSLWHFSNIDDAQTALAEIQKFNFDRVYYLGNGEGTGLALLARSK